MAVVTEGIEGIELSLGTVRRDVEQSWLVFSKRGGRFLIQSHCASQSSNT